MNYQSTRMGAGDGPSALAIAQGLCENGGLFVPERFPVLNEAELAAMEQETYPERAKRILSLYLSDFTGEEIEECVAGAYTEGKFPGGPAPVTAVGDGTYFLELWHGPTCAFKDMALQLLPHLLTRSLEKIHAEKKALILVATSGDTGKAALEGFQNVPGTGILAFYPQNGVSLMQELQMRTQEGGNVSVCAVQGNFDDTQTGVKKIFGNAGIRKRLAESGWMFSSANSINWGRLLPQIVYYFSAYCDLCARGEIKRGDAVNFAVPTGNFGDILAAYYAKKMGLPVHRLICASNSNNVLTDFLTSGVYSRNRKFHTTISPSMDILISSNLERLLYDLTDGDGGKVAGWMCQLSETGEYRVDSAVLDSIRELFSAGCCSDDDTRGEIKFLFETKKYLCDPHTAVASKVYGDYRRTSGDLTPTVIVSTASPYKFAPDVLRALEVSADRNGFEAAEFLSQLTGTPVPQPITSLRSKPVRFGNVCGKDEMGEAVFRFLDRKPI